MWPALLYWLIGAGAWAVVLTMLFGVNNIKNGPMLLYYILLTTSFILTLGILRTFSDWNLLVCILLSIPLLFPVSWCLIGITEVIFMVKEYIKNRRLKKRS
jgi:hypothetical protein